MSDISEIIIEWYIHNKRDLPWRKTKSPYFIWLSEVILQQTRVSQGLNYYIKLSRKYPAIENLASASLDEVLKLWQGLGYYTRARNMHETANMIVNQYNGRFPSNYLGLLKLKGVGPYTAAAVASIAFNEPVAVMDGNVFRVLARLFNENTIVNSSRGNIIFRKLAEKILNKEKAGLHNQALMELGSLICLPNNPSCNRCPLAVHCIACQAGHIQNLPVKPPKSPLRTRYFNYLLICHNDNVYLYQRNKKDIWHSLYEFPLIETEAPLTQTQLQNEKEWNEIMKGNSYIICSVSKVYRHQLTHQIIISRFYKIIINGIVFRPLKHFIPVSWDEIDHYAVPRLLERYLHDLNQGTEH